MDKPIHEREHNDCQQLITNSVDPDWIHILGKQRLPCVKGKVTVYVTCQCSENTDAFGVSCTTNIRLRVV